MYRAKFFSIFSIVFLSSILIIENRLKRKENNDSVRLDSMSKIATLITVPDAGSCTRNLHELAGSADLRFVTDRGFPSH